MLGAQDSTNWLDYILQGGPFALVVVLFVLEKLVTPGERDRLREENNKYKEEVVALNLVIREQIIPLLGKSNDTLEKVYNEITIRDRLRDDKERP